MTDDFAGLDDLFDLTTGGDIIVAGGTAELLGRGQLTPKEAQQVLNEQVSLAASGQVREEACINVDTGFSGGMHFLVHAQKAQETPLITIAGPGSGYLCPGDEVAYPGKAMLKVQASKNAKVPAERWTSAHARLTVTAWREVDLVPKHSDSGSVGSLSRNMHHPKKDCDYYDITPKVSLITFAPSDAPLGAHKRPRHEQDYEPHVSKQEHDELRSRVHQLERIVEHLMAAMASDGDGSS